MHLRAEMLQELLQQDLYAAGWVGPHGTTQRQVAMTSLHTSLLKKFHNEEISEERNNLALTLFLECNEKCRAFGTIQPQSTWDEIILGEFRKELYEFFNPPVAYRKIREFRGFTLVKRREPLLLNLSDIKDHFGLGGGSNIGSKETDWYSKVSLGSMAHTDASLPVLYRHALSSNRLWQAVEDWRAKGYGTVRVKGNKLSFVPKSRKISRTICTEPVLNMLFQKGIGDVIRDRLAEVYRIRLDDQPDRNRRLARIGSLDGRFGTIDLSSASDSISLNLLRQVLPEEPLRWLLRTRSPVTVLPDGSEVELHMISSMGNGFTFPLQTLLFSALVAAVYRVSGIPLIRNRPRRDGNFAVFGDDIIVDRRVYNTMVRMLSLLGFTVNREKSFNEGHFRESCGQDFLHGYNVRGVYVQTLLDAQDLYSAINRLNRWSAYHGICLGRAVGYLRGGCRFIGVPYDEADDAGIKIPFALLRKPRRDRNGAIRYLALRRIPRRVQLPSSDAASGNRGFTLKGYGHFRYSPDGLLQAVVAGYVRGGSVTLRSASRRTVLRNFVCPGWDGRLEAVGESRPFIERWKLFVELNLVS